MREGATPQGTGGGSLSARVGSSWNNAAGNAGVFAVTLNNTLGNVNTNYGAGPAFPVQCSGRGKPGHGNDDGGRKFAIGSLFLSDPARVLEIARYGHVQ